MKTAHTASPCPDPGEWRIVCDFDGTITPFDVTDAILSNFAHPSWEEVEQDWLSGKISARDCMERQVRLIHAPMTALDDFLDAIPITDGFREFTRLCKKRGHNLTVVSDGLDYAIKRILCRHRITDIPVIANRLRRRGKSGYWLEFPYGSGGCPSGVCKCAVAGALGGKTLLIGDGRSDCCVAGVALLVLARRGKELHRHCENRHYPFRVFDDFYAVADLLEEKFQTAEAWVA